MNRRTFLRRAGRAGLAASAFGSFAARDGGAALGVSPLRELARSIEGTVVTPGSPAYAHARLLESTRFDAVHPRAIVYCANAPDVVTSVRWARKHGIHIVARAGGHSYGGYSTTTGVVLDVSRLNAVTLSSDGRTAVVGAGAQLIDVYSKLYAHGVTIPGGSCATVGIAGLALGGGLGYSSRKLGLTCDNVRRVQIVTAHGRLLVCDDAHHPDLYWALRGGGGGNFGIVTSFRFAVHPAANVATYAVEWPWEQAAKAIQAWQAFAPTAPDELFSVCDLLATDQAAGARAHVVSSGQFFGSEADLAALIKPLATTGTPTRVTTQSRTILDAALFWAGCRNETVAQCHTTPRGTLARTSFESKSDYAATQLPPAAIATLTKAIDARQADTLLGRGSILMDAHGGAINRVPEAATAFVHRSELFSLQYVADAGPNPGAARAAANRQWLVGLHAAMRPWVSGGAYQNYIDPGLAGWQAAYYGSNLARLRKVKHAYDPRNVFRFAQSIR